MEGEEASPKRRKIDSSDDNTNTNTEIKMNEAHLAAFKEHGLNDADGAPVEVGPIAPLDADSRQRYVRGAERCPANLEQLAVLENADVAAYKVTSSSSDSGSVDYVATVDAAGGGAPTMLCCDDGVSYDTLSPLQLVEYTFSEDVANPENWLVSCLGMESLDSYKGSKFSFWTRNMATAFDGCAAAFLPEVRRGHALCHMYDAAIFGSAPEEQAEWQTVHPKTGKMINIPRPVHAMRVWDASTQAYAPISPVLPGAPSLEQQAEHWVGFLDELRAALNPKYGPEFIDDCLTMDKDAVKEKYF